jgi:hypothetical protein
VVNFPTATHRFVLAFENSVCQHYVTEKFWRLKRSLVVPVVLSRAIFDGLDVPADAFIAADDFPGGPRDLAAHLIAVAKDPEMFKKFVKK